MKAPEQQRYTKSTTPSLYIYCTMSTTDEQPAEENRSALRDNIERKGKNAYYFAHANTANGPKWDGMIEPKLLSTGSSSVSPSVSMSKLSLMAKSNITNYAFLDDGAKVKIYVNLPGVGNCDDENISIDFTERSLCLTVKDYVIASPAAPSDSQDKGELIVDSAPETVEEIVEESKEDRCLTFAKLYGDIEKATFKKKPDKVIITLKKKDDSKWSSIIA